MPKFNDIIELFSFPNPPKRPSWPESAGLRHLAFEVDNLDKVIIYLTNHKIAVEPVGIDKITNMRFTFIADPDNLPIEFCAK